MARSPWGSHSRSNPASGNSIEDAEPGTLVTLNLAGRGGTTQGMLARRWREEDGLHVLLYSFAWRDTLEYWIDRRGYARTVAPPNQAGSTEVESGAPCGGADATSEAPGHDPESPPDGFHTANSPGGHRDTTPAYRRFRNLSFFAAMVAVAILLVLTVPLAQGGLSWFRASLTPYESFLERDMSLSRLVSFVSSRVDYARDVEDYWSAPHAVWETRGGDCEDYASVISDYLYRHDVDHVLVTMSLKDGLQGHAAVVAFTDRGPALLDPTRATTPTGFERYPAGTSLREIITEYAVVPFNVHDPPVEPGRPEPSRTIR